MSAGDSLIRGKNKVQITPGVDLGEGDIEALAQLVMMEAAKEAQDDLRSVMSDVKAVNASKAAARNASVAETTLDLKAKNTFSGNTGPNQPGAQAAGQLGAVVPANGTIGAKVGARPGTTGGASGGAGSIILEPRQMFQTLQETENATREIINLVKEIAKILEAASMVTFAVGFGELVKVAEAAINQVGSAVVAANNAFNSACKEVVNQLVNKFASEGAKSDYSEPPFQEITIQINEANRAQVYPSVVRALFDDQQQHNRQLSQKTSDIRDLYRQTVNFWVGTAADKTRQAFESRVVPKFEELLDALNNIVTAGFAWVDDAIRFEASLGV